MDITVDTPTDLELAQQGARDAAEKIANAAAETALWRRRVALRPQRPALNVSSNDSGRLRTFHPFPRLPWELQVKILKFSLPPNQLVLISSDNYYVEVKNPFTGEVSIETIPRAKAAMVFPVLCQVSPRVRSIVLGRRYLCGLRLRYIPLYLNLATDTIFFEDADALTSLLAPIGDHEQLDDDKEENVLQAFGENGIRNIVLAGPVKSYEDLYSIIKHFAWIDTLIMEEPSRSPRTSTRAIIDQENAIRSNLEDQWRDHRGSTPNLVMPIIRFLPAQNIDLMRATVRPTERGIQY